MKTITRKLVAASAVILTLAGLTPVTNASDITLEGRGQYELGSRIRFYPDGARQGGRYGNLGADYYHDAKIGVDWVLNRSPRRGGRMSFEFWGMPYYGAARGIVLMTRGLDSLSGGGTITDARSSGKALFLNTYRYPEINIWEYTNNVWKFRDALSFSRKARL